MEKAKRIGTAAGFGAIVALVAWVVLPGITWQVLFGLIFFGTALELVLEKAEAGTATGRTVALAVTLMKNQAPWFAGVLVFLAARIVGGYIFGMPLAATYGSAFGEVESVRSATQNLTLEVLFSIIGVGLAYAATTSAKARKYLYGAACVAFVVVLYQAKAPEMSNGISRVLKATGIRAGQAVCAKATEVETGVEPIFGRANLEASLYQAYAGGFRLAEDKDGDPVHLKAGALALSLTESRTHNGFVMMKVQLPSKEGDFISGGPVVWVDARAFEWGVRVGPNGRPTDSPDSRLAKKR